MVSAQDAISIYRLLAEAGIPVAGLHLTIAWPHDAHRGARCTVQSLRLLDGIEDSYMPGFTLQVSRASPARLERLIEGVLPSCQPETLPNIVVIFADDLGQGELDSPVLTTPNLERLADTCHA